MKTFNRRSVLKFGLAAASAAVVRPAASQAADYKETIRGPGVVQRAYGVTPSMIPGYKTVSLRDVVVQPGAKTKEGNVMQNDMICHITEGELQVVQDGKTYTARKNYVWTCTKGQTEHVINNGKLVGVMRVTDLKV